MSQQIQITGGAKVRNLEGVLTGSSGVVSSLGINVPDGIPQLDGSGKILVSQLPNSVMEYKGTWDASTNTPTLADGTGNAGDVYVCNVAGTVNFGSGPIVFYVGDQVLYSGTIWQRASGSSGTVTSVSVTESGDALTITGSPITTSGTINIGFSGNSGQYINGAGGLTTFPTDNITGSGSSGQVTYFDGTNTITGESSFVYDASTNRLGVNTSVPNATIGANAPTDGGYSLLLKNDNTNYNGIGFATSSVYGNVIGTEKLGTAPAMNMTLLNQSGYISLTETGNLGVNIINPNSGVDIYSSTSSSLWLHTANSGVSGTDGVRFSLFSNSNAVLRNNEGSLAMSSEGDFYVITLGAENIRVNSTDGKVGIGNPTTVSEMLTVNGSIQQAGVLSSMLKTNGDGKIIAAVAGTDYVAPSSLSGYVPTSRTITINGTPYDLSADRSWSVGTITGSGADGRVPYFNGASSISYDSGFIYESGANRLGVNTVSPNATIGANAPTDGIYSLLLKNSDTNYSGIGFGTSSVYGNTIETVRIGTAPSRNLTLYNYAGYVSITESGNLGVNILTPNNGIDIYHSTQSQLWLHNNATGVSATDGVRLALFNNKSANLVNFDGPLSLTAEGEFSIITSGTRNLWIDNTTGYVGIGDPSTILAQLHIYNAENAASLLLQTNGSTSYSEIAVRNAASVATSYFRQYSSSTTGTDFGLSRANLATFFSNYASNFAIGTQNGGDLILGTANTERMRIAASTGNVVIGSNNTTSNRKLVVYSATADAHLAIIGTAPSVRFTDNFTATYSALFGMATASNNYVTGAVAGDFVITYNSSNNLIFGNSNTSLEKMRINSSGNLLINTTTDNGAKLNVNGVIYGTRARLNNSYDNSSVSLNVGGQTYMDSRTSRLYQTYNLSSMSNYMHIYDPYATSNANGGISIGASSSITTLPSTSIIHFDGVNNRVGIGTTAPSAALSVVGAATFSSSVTAGARSFIKGSAGYLFDVEEQGSNKARLQSYVVSNEVALIAGYDTTAVPMTFYAGGSERMRITSGGRVGIGTSSPDGNTVMTVYDGSGNGDAALFSGTGTKCDIWLKDANTTNGHVRLRSESNSMIMTAGGTERMRITSAGNVGIYNTLYAINNIRPADGAYGGIDFTNNGIGYQYAAKIYSFKKPDFTEYYGLTNDYGAGTGAQLSIIAREAGGSSGNIGFYTGSGTERVRINSNGEFLVGTNVGTSTDPVHRIGTNGGTTYGRLMIQERTGVWLSFNTSVANIGTVYQNGSVVVYGGTSDYRLKENIKPMANGLERVMKLNPVEYTWKRDGSFGEGFIAHELQEVVPIAVTGKKDGINEAGEPDWQNIDKSHIVPILVKAIQELKAEIDILKNK